MINELIKYQQWRTGETDATLDEIGLTPAKITACINWAIESLTNGIAAHDAEVSIAAGVAGLRRGVALANGMEINQDSILIEMWCKGYKEQLRAKAKQ